MASDDIIAASAAEGRPPAVLQIIPSLVSGGAERGTIELAGALVDAGWTAYVASSGGPLERQLARLGVRHLTLPLASKNPLVIRRNAAALRTIIRRNKIDIVHARSRAPAWSAWLAARAAKRRFVTTFHNAYDEDLPLKHWYNSVMARGDRVIAISQFVGEHVARVYGVGADRLRVVPRGVDLRLFDPQCVRGERVAELAAQWRVPEDAKVVMLPGRLTRWKGGLDLIAAMARLGRRDLCCLLVGAEQRRGFRRELERTVERLGLLGMVRIVNECRDMPAAYMLADVVVSASTDPEGFGRVIVEAQAMGKPVVATDHGGARETIRPGVTGWLAPPGDPAALAAAIGEAIALDEAQRAAFAHRARAHVAGGYACEAMCAKTIDVYEELLFPEAAVAAPNDRPAMAVVA
jgi:glycosyltransferase involved in cell wall biosynthesis